MYCLTRNILKVASFFFLLLLLLLFAFFFFAFFCLKMTDASSSSLRSFHIIRKEKKSQSKYLYDKVQSNGEIRNGETFRIFSFFQDSDLVVNQIGNEMEGNSERFSIKRKEQYSRIAFCVKITQLFILSYLTTPC